MSWAAAAGTSLVGSSRRTSVILGGSRRAIFVLGDGRRKRTDHLHLGQQQEEVGQFYFGWQGEEDKHLRYQKEKEEEDPLSSLAPAGAGEATSYCTVYILNIFCANKWHSKVKNSLKGDKKSGRERRRERRRAGAPCVRGITWYITWHACRVYSVVYNVACL